MKRTVKNVSLLLLLGIVFSGCTRRIVDFTVISSKNVPITEEGVALKKAESRVQGKDSKISVLFFGGIPDMKEAIDRAIEKHPGAIALTDGVVKYKSWTCFFFGKNQYIVEGTPLFAEQKTPETLNIINPSTPTSTEEKPTEPTSDNKKEIEPTRIRIIHTVERNETLTTIAEMYGVSAVQIIKWNDLTSNKVSVGKKLNLFISDL